MVIRVANTEPKLPPRDQLPSIGEKCFQFVRENATAGDPKSVLDAIDTFGYEHQWMMCVGDVKGELLDQEVTKLKPKILAELGGFSGYSAIRFANKLRELSGPAVHVYSFEISPQFAAIATKMIDFAGLSDIVTIFVGTFEDKYADLKALGVDHVDVFFLDHDKKSYKSDMLVIEKSGLLQSGSVVMADNVVFHQINDYLEYIRAHANFTSVLYESYLEYSDLKDGLEVSTYVA
ncbi:hypothetical protein PRIC2_007992 [Phytophthora ramorum]